MNDALICVATFLFVNVCSAGQAPVRNDCSTLKYRQHKVSCLCGTVAVCSGDICGRPSGYDLDNDFVVLLRDSQGNTLDSQKLTYTKGQPTFCFEGKGDGKYQIAFTLYKNGTPEPSVVFPTSYKRSPEKACDTIYMVEPICPQ